MTQKSLVDAGIGWVSYVPTVTQDGTAASAVFRGGVVRYTIINKTVFLQGNLQLGESGAGGGGTFIKMTLPISGKAATNQNGIGHITRTNVGITAIIAGFGGISSAEVSVIRLMKGEGAFVIPGDASLNYGVTYSINGQYEID